MEATRDLGCADLWAKSLEQSLARRGRPRRASVELYRLRPERDLSSPRALRESSAYWQIRRTAVERAAMPLTTAGGGAALALLAATTLPSLLGGRGTGTAIHAQTVEPAHASGKLTAAITRALGRSRQAARAASLRHPGSAAHRAAHHAANHAAHHAAPDSAVLTGPAASQAQSGLVSTTPGPARATAAAISDAAHAPRPTHLAGGATPTAGPAGPATQPAPSASRPAAPATHLSAPATHRPAPARHIHHASTAQPSAGPVDPAPRTPAKAKATPRRAAPKLSGVQAVQRRLGLSVDGDFGPATKRAVQRFQRSHGLTPDGVVGPGTRAALGLGPGPVLREPGSAAVKTPRTPPAAPGQSTAASGGPSIGTSTPSTGATAEIAEMVAAGNVIATRPYIYGGGHGSFNSIGYDCSGSVSYVLHAAGLLSSPEDSSGLESYGAPGPGRYVTIYANAGHAWMTIDGRRFDTIALQETGTRWSSTIGSSAGYVVRHPVGL